MVDLALSSAALAIYARANDHPPAAVEASVKYCRLLKVVRGRISQLSSSFNREDTDACLLTVSLMGRYEIATYRPERGSPSPHNSYHQDGAVALLTTWNNHLKDQTPTFILKQTRTELIKSALLRNISLPDWMLSDSCFGGQNVEPDYDRLIARLVKLHHASAPDQCEGLQFDRLEELITEARNLDGGLRDWALQVPATCSPKRHNISNLEDDILPRKHIYSSTLLSFPKPGNAAAWSQYFAARMLVGSIRLRLLEQNQHVWNRCSYEQQQLECITQLQTMADNLAASIPFCFEMFKIDSNPSSTQASLILNENAEVKPYLASLVVWPLMIASSLGKIDSKQKLWFRSELAMLGKLIGDGTIEYVELDKQPSAN